MKQDEFKLFNQQLVKPAHPSKFYFRAFITGAVSMLITLILVFAAIIFTAKLQS